VRSARTSGFGRRRRLRRRDVLLAGVCAAAMAVTVALFGSANATTTPLGTIRAADAPEAVPGSYLVIFKHSKVSSAEVDGYARHMTKQWGGAVRQTWHSAVRGFELRAGARTARSLAADPRVAYVEQNRVLHLLDTQINPPSFGLDRVDQRALPVDRMFTAPDDAANVQAFIIDTGIRVTHSDFGGRATFAFNATGDGIDTDCNGHGTHVAGTVGGSAFGLAKAVQLMAVKVLDCNGAGDVASVVNGINFVTQHATLPAVANMSLGGGASDTIDAAVNASIKAGVTYAIAAGNENQDACNDSPARVPAAITVGATDQSDRRAFFSNVGTCLDIFAPGVNIRSDFATSDNSTQVLSGTSMSTPHVTGAAALVLGLHPDFTPQQVRDSLVTASTPDVIADPGNGSPNNLLFIAQQ
jgi:subtilisin family serine protease